MKLTYTSEDELKIVSRGLQADCFLVGNGEAEVKIDKDESPKLFKLELFARKVCKKLVKEGICDVYFLAEGGSKIEECLKKSRRFGLSDTEYMFFLNPDQDRKAEAGAELLVRNGKEEEGETIIVESAEKGVFIAKLRPLNGGMYIYGVEVREDLRGQGFGKKYMKSLIHGFRDTKLYLQVGSSNKIACKLYRSIGFEAESEVCYYIM